MARVKELILEDCPHGPESCLTVMHADAYEEAQALVKEYSDLLGITDVQIYNLPPAILVHAGPGALAISYFRKSAA